MKPVPLPFNTEEVSELIGLIYDCTLDPGLWEAALHRIKDLLHCQAASLLLDDLGAHTTIVTKSAGIDAFWLERQAELAPEVTEIITNILASGQSFDGQSDNSGHASGGGGGGGGGGLLRRRSRSPQSSFEASATPTRLLLATFPHSFGSSN